MHYLPASEDDKRAMLSAIGAARVDELFKDIPPEIRCEKGLDIPAGLSEQELKTRMAAMAARNTAPGGAPCFLGAGAYDHFSPAAVDHLLSRTEFYSSYTPYQPEMSQGTLQSIFEFQTMMADLTGMDVSNASLYDGASATAEAALMASRIRRGKKILVARSIHPADREVLGTFLRCLDLDTVEVPFGRDGRMDLEALSSALCPDVCALLVGQPNFFGVVEDLPSIARSLEAVDKKPLLAVTVSEALSLAILNAPGSSGADIVAGDARSFGLPLGYGGPYLGFVTAKKAHIRQIPGRICGQTTDEEGRRGFVLTLTTREQHIRRERATSNICTNEGLCMLGATIYLALMGRRGLTELARLNLSKSEYLKEALAKRGITPLFDGPTFNEFAVKLPAGAASKAAEALAGAGMIGGYPLGGDYADLQDGYLVCATEQVRREDCDRFAEVLGGLK
ncbi:MAG: aminomethyl-transferring glycine dehydrogenase subunit GcvPA [Acidobacteriota bacterium]